LTRSNNLFDILIIIFLNCIATGQTDFKTPTCGNAER